MNYGFVRVATAIPSVKVGDCKYNAQQIENLIIQAEGKGVEIICFPELCITAYTCGDLFNQKLLTDEAEMGLISILDFTRSLDIISIVGLPIYYNGVLFNCAAVIQKGRILGLIPKTYLSNYRELNEMRWFAPGYVLSDANVMICGQTVPLTNQLIFSTPSCRFGVELSQDAFAPIPLSSELSLRGAEIIFNIGAESESTGKHDFLKSHLAHQSARCHCGYVFAGAGFGESTQDIVFAGKGLIYENGKLLAEAERFSLREQLIVSEIDIENLRIDRQTDTAFRSSIARTQSEKYKQIDTEFYTLKDFDLSRNINPLPFVPSSNKMHEQCEEIFAIQIEGLAKRLIHTQTRTAVIGISGGLDSTLALLVCAKTFDKLGLSRRGIVGVTMPGFGTTDRTYTNAINLMRILDITVREIDIKNACLQHFEDIGANPDKHDVTYENSQARERTQILMDVANQMNGLVIGTGDLSELALGWATYNGDHMSNYSVNASVPKTLIRHLVTWIAKTIIDEEARPTLFDIVDTPISPELIPADENGEIRQKTEDLVGPYELHDFFLYYTLRYGYRPSKIFFLAEQAFKGKYTIDVIHKWLTTFYRRFFSQQFKRSCMPDGPKVGSCCLSPRGNWQMPSDASATAWLEECNSLLSK